MKKIMFVLLNLLFIQYGLSQQSLDSLLKSLNARSVSIKGINAVYNIDSISYLCGVMNKDLYFDNISDNIGSGQYIITLDNADTLKSIFKEILSEHLRYLPIGDRDNITLRFVADMSGRIHDMSFMYKADLNIPIVLIEKIEQAIKEGCYLKFDRNTPALLNADRVTLHYVVFLKETCF